MITDQVSKLPSPAIFGRLGQLAMNLVALMCFSVGVSAQIADWSVVTEGASGDPLTYGSGQYVGQSKHNAVVDAEGNTIAAHPAGNDRNYDALIVKHGPDGTVVWTSRYANRDNLFGTTPMAIALDEVGDVYVAASSQDYSGMCIAVVKLAAGSGVITWVSRQCGTASSDTLFPRAIGVAGGAVYVAGSIRHLPASNDYLVLKLDPEDGALQWRREYIGGGDPSGYDTANDLAIDSMGNVVVTGDSVSTEGHIDFVTTKYSPAGDILWQSRNDDLASADYSAQLELDAAGNVLVAGRSSRESSGLDFLIFSLAGDTGFEQWKQRYSGATGNGDDTLFALTVDAYGDAYLTGTSAATDGGKDVLTVKFAGASGMPAWAVRNDSPGEVSNDIAFAVQVDAAGGAFVSGTSIRDGVGTELLTIKYNALNGAVVWSERRLLAALTSDSQMTNMKLDATGDVRVLAAQVNPPFQVDIIVDRLNGSDGHSVWQAAEGEDHQLPQSTSCMSGGNRMIALDTAGATLMAVCAFNGNRWDYEVLKLSDDGAQIWRRRLTSVANGFRMPGAVAVDSAGNLIVVGTTRQQNSYSDAFATKFSGADGHEVWTAVFDGAAHLQDGAAAVSVDASGDVFLTGRSEDAANTDDVFAAKYFGTSGALAWSRILRGMPDDGVPDVGVDITNDAFGNVYVAANSEFQTTNRDFLIAKYVASTGALVWSNRYNNAAANGSDSLVDIAVDSHGDVIATGESQSDGDRFDATTVKFSGVNGAVAWVARTDGLTDMADRPAMVAVDGNDDVVIVVTSSTLGLPGATGITLKYSGLTGATIWESRLQHPSGIEPHDASALVVNAADDILALLTSTSASGNQSAIVQKYAGQDGSKRWQYEQEIPSADVKPRSLVLSPDNSLRLASDLSTVAGARVGLLKLLDRPPYGPGHLFSDCFE